MWGVLQQYFRLTSTVTDSVSRDGCRMAERNDLAKIGQMVLDHGRWQACGHGGNFIFIVPGKEMVIFMTSMPDVDDDRVGTELDDFEGLIQPLLEQGQ